MDMTLDSLFDLVLSLEGDTALDVPLLRNLAVLDALRKTKSMKTFTVKPDLLEKKINRHYYRLCRVQEDLGRLDFKKAAAGVSVEDFVFSQIDFSRYREMPARDFERLFPEGLMDFGEAFLKDNFGFGREEIQSLIERSYKKEEGLYKIRQESPLILSVMRTLDTSLENSSLFGPEEISGELQTLSGFLGSSGTSAGRLPEVGQIYPGLVSGLDGLTITHDDGMKTNLFISPQGDLSAIFRPGNKAWTRVLIGSDRLNITQ